MVVLSASGEWAGELQAGLYQRGIATSAAQTSLLAVDLAGFVSSAVMVLDVASHDAIAAVQKAQTLRPQTKIIAVSDSRPELDTALALIGAVDYFLLFPSQNIPQLVRVIERNENIFSAAGFRVDVSLRTAEYNGVRLDLSPVEFQILTAMVQAYNGHRRVTCQDLARGIYKEELTEKEAITRLKTHLFNLRQKLAMVMGQDPLKSRKGVVYWVRPR